ncbi:unnamed protein product, partial [Durusdinium trenchii]
HSLNIAGNTGDLRIEASDIWDTKVVSGQKDRRRENLKPPTACAALSQSDLLTVPCCRLIGSRLMGIDAEGLILEATGSATGSGWKVRSWTVDLPRCRCFGGKYSLLFELIECQSQEGRSLPVLTADFSRELCDEFSPQYQFLAVVPGQVATLVEAESDDISLGHFFAHGVESYARCLLNLLRDVRSEEEDVECLWDPGHYGDLLVRALTLGCAEAGFEADLSSNFFRGGEGKRISFEATKPHLVGKIEIEFENDLEEGLLCFEDADQPDVTITGHKVTVDLGCKKLRKFALEADAIQRLRSGLSGRMEHDSEGC